MKNKHSQLSVLLATVLSIIAAITFTNCSNEDEPKSAQTLCGEWISTSKDIYYQFSSDGTGRYICLADEPGYNPEYPDAVIQKPEDPYYFDYIFDGEILTMKEYYNQDKTSYTIYVYDIVLSADILQMKLLRTSDDGIEWMEYESRPWRIYNRWTAK